MRTAEQAEPKCATQDSERPHVLRASHGRELSPLTWLSVSCLDAPIVAVSWQWLFARSLHAHISNADQIVLFLTAWFIYLGDRIVDSLTVPPHGPASARQRFCLEHRTVMLVAMALIAVTDATCALRAIDRETLLFGAIVGAAIGGYLTTNHMAAFLWRKVPAKEVSIGFLFGLGTVAAIHVGGFGLFSATFLFGALCSLNCLSISVWERPLDIAQARVSFATVLPDFHRLPQFASYVLAAAALLLAPKPVLRPIAFCIASSAVALAILHRTRGISRDERVALADLVLLTPLLFQVA